MATPDEKGTGWHGPKRGKKSIYDKDKPKRKKSKLKLSRGSRARIDNLISTEEKCFNKQLALNVHAGVTRTIRKYFNEVELVMEWIKTQNTVPYTLTEFQVIVYLNSSDYDVASTRQLLKKSYIMRSECPKVFQGRDPFLPQIIRVWEVMDLVILPQRTCEDYQVIYCALRITDPKEFDSYGVEKVFYMLLDASFIKRGLPRGQIFILSTEGVTFRHFPITDISHMRKTLTCIQDCSPVVIKGLHMVNCKGPNHPLFNMCKPFIQKSLFDQIHFHMKGSQSLFNFVCKKYLPTEIGGDLGPISEIKIQARQELESLRCWFIEEEQQRS